MTLHRQRRLTSSLRQRFAELLVAVYILAVHGLPALHLAWHHGDHVHELGGFRRLAALPGHTHAGVDAPRADESATEFDAPLADSQPRLRAARAISADGLAQHLAAGPAHGLSTLLLPMEMLWLPPAAFLPLRKFFVIARAGRDFYGRAHARAPPAAA